MRHHYAIILFLLAAICCNSCARQSSPMGGPKDEDPPKLVSSNPENETTNIEPSEILLTFNEYIKVENLTNQVIMTSGIHSQQVEFMALNNQLRIRLNHELEDKTPYVFNCQKSVQDIREGNPANRLKLAFSTGDEID